MIKTYGTKSFMEWQALISVGKARVSVPFTGGTLSAGGISPATYTTNNKVLQKVIEGSTYFRSGKIYLVRQIAEPEKEEGGDRKKERERLQGSIASDLSDKTDKSGSVNSASVKQVEVSDLDAAKEYLMETFGLRASDLRSKVAILNAAKAHGVELVGLG